MGFRHCCRANVPHEIHSRPDSGLGFQVKILKTFQVFPSWLESRMELSREQGVEGPPWRLHSSVLEHPFYMLGCQICSGIRCSNLISADVGSNVSQFENNYFTEMCSGSEAGSYLRLVDFLYHPTLGSRVIKKKKKNRIAPRDRKLLFKCPFGKSILL